jgi:drug/metabolite transporter (DMT)-like permease
MLLYSVVYDVSKWKDKEINMNAKAFFTKPLNIFICAIIATFLWGSAFPAIKKGYELFAIPSEDIATKILFAGIRFTLAGIFVTIFNWVMHKRVVLPSKSELKGIIPLALIQTTLQYIFFYISLVYLTGVKGSILNSIGNFFAVILAHFCFASDRLNFTKVVGCALGFVGVVVCCVGGEGIDMSFKLMGDGFILIAAFCFALGSVITKVITKDSDSVMITGFNLGMGGVLLMVIGIVFGGHLTFTSASAVALLLYLALLSSVAFAVWAQLLKYNPVGKISVYCFLNPVFGVILSGIVLRDDFLNWGTLAALILVSLGVYVVNRTPKAKKI